jgi:hypothetical protein
MVSDQHIFCWTETEKINKTFFFIDFCPIARGDGIEAASGPDAIYPIAKVKGGRCSNMYLLLAIVCDYIESFPIGRTKARDRV